MQRSYFDPSSPLTDKEKAALGSELSLEATPGTILADIATLLSWIEAGKVPATESSSLGLSVLPALNAAMRNPLVIGLERPKLKSLPNLLGLFLLLRVSGLVQIQTEGKQRRLALEDNLAAVWRSLNPVEQYLTLLEAWLIRGDLERIGEREVRLYSHVEHCVRFFRDLPPKGVFSRNAPDLWRFMRFYPGLHTVALAEIFGWLEIRQGTPDAGKGWKIERLEPRTFGRAMLKLLHQAERRSMGWEYDRDPDAPMGELRLVLQPFFPDYQRSLPVPERVFIDGVHFFRLSLPGTGFWRRLAVPADCALDEVCATVLNAVDFDFDHLYEFTWHDLRGERCVAAAPQVEDEVSATEVEVGAMELPIGGVLELLYDFGDCWNFKLTLERIEPTNAGRDVPELLEGRGVPPPQYGDADDLDDEDLDEDELEDDPEEELDEDATETR